MSSSTALRAAFDAAIGAGGPEGPERLCRCCVELLEIDGAALSLVSVGKHAGTLGASSSTSARIDELQFTFGEGPCLDAVSGGVPVLVPDLTSSDETRWPAFTSAVLPLGVRGIFALPVAGGGSPLGALDLYRSTSDGLSPAALQGGLLAAELAAGPLIQAMRRAAAEQDADTGPDHEPSTTWQRVEVYQATGMLMGQLDIGSDEAEVRLRAYAFAHNMTATEVARAVVARELTFADEPAGPPSLEEDGGP